MRQSTLKTIAAILFGIVFFVAGVTIASAADVVPDASATAQSTPIASTQTTSPSTSALAVPSDPSDFLFKSFSCSGFSCIISFLTALPAFLSYFAYKVASWLLIGACYIFDQMLSWSIEGPLVTPDFINTLWTIVRDFSNMIFIFILIYTGIRTMLFGEKWQRAVIQVIVVALLINFSLFFTKIVIDAGNILAVGIKSSIQNGNGSISEGLIGAFKPQAFLSAAGMVTNPGDAAIVFVIATIVSGFVAYILFKIAILFSRRLIVFWALMIFSPFAFISMTLPGKANKFGEWLDSLVSLTFVAPIFLFFIYLIMQVINAPAPAGGKLLDFFTPHGTDWLTKILGPVMVAALLVKALQEILKITEDFAGSTGEGFSNLVTGAMGMTAAGTAMAGVGGVRFLSAVGGKLEGKSGTLGAIGGAAAAAGHAGRSFTFDVRNIPIPGAGTVGSVAGIGAGRTTTLETTKIGAVKTAEEKAKRAAEKPQSVGQAVAKAEEKRKEKEEKEAAAKEKKERRVAELEDKKRDLQEKYGELLAEARTDPTKYENAHNVASAELRAAEKAIDLAEETGTPAAKAAATTRYAQALAGKKTAEKELSMYTTGNAELNKIHKELEDLKA